MSNLHFFFHFTWFWTHSTWSKKKKNETTLSPPLRHESRNIYDIPSKQASLDRLPPFPFRTRPLLRNRCETTLVDRRSTNELSHFLAATRDLLRPCMIAPDSGTIRVKRHRQATSVLRRRLTDERVRRLSSTRSTGHVPRNERKLWRRDWEQQPRIGRAIPLGEANPVIGRSCNPLPRERKLSRSSLNDSILSLSSTEQVEKGVLRISFSGDELGWMLIEWESIRWEIS